MSKFLILGPVTHDTIMKSGSTCHGIGGPVYYQSNVLSTLKSDVTAVITLGRDGNDLIDYFPPDMELVTIWKDETMEFENFYPDSNPNHRVQRAHIPLNSIKVSHISNIDMDAFDAALVSPLSPGDIPSQTLKYISQQGLPVYLGVQGYLRHLEGHKVILKPWKNHEKFLKYVDFLFMDEVEAGVMMGQLPLSLDEISSKLSLLGPEEVIITRGSRGSVIYSQSRDDTYRIHAFPSKQTVDPTGLGDTYLAAYAFKKQESSDPQECGIFASLVSSLKLEKKGAFQGSMQQIEERRSQFVH
ncbi:PfkB family carbohydrate kinase [Methanobacterium petrolearium]|uniref:PfkB family carbohydrate kinase n=1 Tax=Methanobacterium petrolearium TaxID=710190 RepID=UPI001AE7436A|nr:PfkB family carbohydrate kinase [Methanobacterium petrolearium]MBP1946678.1 sugar/nucleoside kinase (ribokinase family) [Methanobacterium petrolearium]